MSTDQRPVAFISHHSSQGGVARHLVRVLARHGIKGWMAPDDIEAGRPFDEVIIEQIRASELILLLFCARSDQSKHVKREIMLAEDTGKLIYPIRLEAIQPAGLAYWLQDYQWTDWLDQRDATIDRMVEVIKRRLPAASLPTSEPASQTVDPLAVPEQKDRAPETHMLRNPATLAIIAAAALVVFLFIFGMLRYEDTSRAGDGETAAAATEAVVAAEDPFANGASGKDAVSNVMNAPDPVSAAAAAAGGPPGSATAISDAEFERRKAELEALSQQQGQLSDSLNKDDAAAKKALEAVKM